MTVHQIGFPNYVLVVLPVKRNVYGHLAATGQHRLVQSQAIVFLYHTGFLVSEVFACPPIKDKQTTHLTV